jgi:hypothetical protein
MSHRWKRLRRVSVTSPGDQYTEKPAVTISPPAAPKQEAQGTAALNVNGTVNSVNLDSGGNFYSTPPAVTLSAPDSGGVQATGTAQISNGEVTGVTITNPGSGYSTTPTVTIAKSTDPKTDFAAAVTLEFDSATGTVTKVNVSDSGNFYDSDNPPVVTIDPPFPSTNFERGEDVTIQADANGAVVSGEVGNFIESSQTLSLIHTANDDGTFVEPSSGLTITGSNSGASRKITKVTRPEIAGDVSDEFNEETQDFLDFSESNPFGEPEVASIVQEEAAAAVVASAPATQMTVRGASSDPAFVFPKTYKIIANGVSYQFVADEDDKNYIEGVRDLNIPGFAVSTHSTDSVTDAIQVTYTPQTAGDTLTLAGDGFIHLGIPEGNYELNPSSETAPTSSALQPGDSAAPRLGDSVDAGFMTDVAFSTQVSRSATSMVWDSAATNFGTSIGSISYIRNYPLVLSDVPGLSDPSNIVFGENGRRAYYTNLNYADSSAIVYGAKLESPYDISSISDGDEERADLSTVFARSFYSNADSDQFYGGQRLSAVAFNPHGTKMYVVEADRDILNQFNLSDSWDITTATYEKGLVGSVPYGYTVAQNNVTVNSSANLNNTYSMEWYDSGRKMAVGKLGVNGPVDELTFTTPYDIGTLSSRTYHTNNIPDSSGYVNQFEYKLAFTAGSMFNHDGTRRYFLHNQFSDSDYDSSSSGYGNGLNGWRKTLLRTDLSSPYDLSTMSYHSQIELTNRADSGAPTKMGIRGAFGMHPDGSKIYVLTNTMEDIPVDSGWTGTSQFNIVEFGTSGDSAGSSFITHPDISVKPMVQADSADAWAEAYMANSSLTAWKQITQADPNSPHYVTPPPPVSSSVPYSISLIDSEGAYTQLKYTYYESQVPVPTNFTFTGDGNYLYMSGNDLLIQYGPLNTPYDIETTASNTTAITWGVNGSGWDHHSNMGFIEPYKDTVSSYQNYSGGHGFYSPHKIHPNNINNIDAMQNFPRYHQQTTPGAFSTQSTNNAQTISYHFDDLDLVLDSDVDARDIRGCIRWLGNSGAYFGLFSKGYGSSKGAQLAVWSQPGDKYSADGYYSYGTNNTTYPNKYVAPGWAANYVGGKDLKGLINNYHGINESNFSDFEMNDYGNKVWLLSRSSRWLYELTLTTPYNPKTATYNGTRFAVTKFNIPTSLHWNESRGSLFIGGDGVKINGSYTTQNGIVEYKLENTNYVPLQYTPGTLSNKVISGDVGERPSQYSSSYIAPFMSLQPDRIQFHDNGTKLFLTNSNFVEAHYYNLADSYDITSAVLDSSMSIKNGTEATNAFTVGSTDYSGRRGTSDLMFNDSGTEVTVHQSTSTNPSYAYWTTFYLDSAFDLNSINNTTPLQTQISTHNNGGLQQWLQNTHNTYIGQFVKHSRFADNGNKLIWYDPGYTDNMLIYNLPEPYNVHSIENWYGESADLFSLRNWDSGSWRDYSITKGASATAFFDFDFNDSGTRMWATDYGSGNYNRLIWQFDLNTAWDLQTVDSASWELIYFPDSGDNHISTTDLGGIATTPNGMLYTGAQNKVDSAGNTIMGNIIFGWDLTKDSNNRPYIFPADSDNSYFRSSATHLISTVETGLLYSNDPRTASTGNVFALAINEGILADSSDSSYTADSAYIVSIAQDDLYGGGYGNAFQLQAGVSIAWGGDRAVVWGGFGGNTPGEKIDYFSIPTPGNASVFGNVHRQVDGFGPGKRGGVCVSDKTYGVYAGGNSEHNYNGTDQIDYITFATIGNSSDFGSLTTKRENVPAGASDGTTGYITGGQQSVSPWAEMTSTDTITIATPGNAAASSFTLATGARYTSGANDETRMIIAGGYTANNNNNSLIQYFTFSTPGTSTTFGNLSDNRAYATATSDKTHALIAGGYENVSSLNLATTDVITIQTTGNATNFGNLNRVNRAMGASSNGTYATFGGGFGSPHIVDIDRFNFSSAATATDHGDLINAGEQPGACSGNAA